MSTYSLENALLGVASERPAINDPTIPRHGSQPPIYICIDTLDVFQDTGSDWLLVGQLGITGLTSDMAAGINVAGSVVVSPDTGPLDPPGIDPGGRIVLRDTLATMAQNLDNVSLTQSQDVDVNGGGALVSAVRSGDTSLHDYVSPILQVLDFTNSAQPALQVSKGGATRLQVDATGVQVTGAVAGSNAALAGVGGATPTLAVTKLAGQTGLLIACIDENNSPKVSIAVDGEIVTADDVLAPSGVIKGATVALYTSGTGAPSSGVHGQGEFHGDTAGALFYCTVSGTPGTWAQVNLT